MSRSRAATPAGRTRAASTGTRRSGGSTTSKRPAAKPSKAKRPAPKRSTAKRPATKAKRPATKAKRPATKAKRPAAKRSPAKRPATKRPAKRRPKAAAKTKRSGGLMPALSWRQRLLVFLCLAIAAGAGYMFWLRDSSLVAVTDVEVVGVTGGERAEIVAALTGVGKEMTTLNTDVDRIESVAARFPTIAGVDVDPNFPHGLRLEIEERPPRLFIEVAGEQVPVAGDGTVLDGVSVSEEQSLPVLGLSEVPASGRLSGEPLEQALVVGAAPDPLLPLIEKVHYSEEFGVELIARGGIEVRFGSGDRAVDKWASAAAVLADPKLDAATYVDVRVPERPVAGGAA